MKWVCCFASKESKHQFLKVLFFNSMMHPWEADPLNHLTPFLL